MNASERAFCCTLLREANAQLMDAAFKDDFAGVRSAARSISRVQGYLLLDEIPWHELAALNEIQRLSTAEISLSDGLDIIDRMARIPPRLSEREDPGEDPRFVAQPEGGALTSEASGAVLEVPEVPGVAERVGSPPPRRHDEQRVGIAA